ALRQDEADVGEGFVGEIEAVLVLAVEVEQVKLATPYRMSAVEEPLPRPRILPRQQPPPAVEQGDRLELRGRQDEPWRALASVLKREDVWTVEPLDQDDL